MPDIPNVNELQEAVNSNDVARLAKWFAAHGKDIPKVSHGQPAKHHA